jgi:chromosome segregation ATPase
MGATWRRGAQSYGHLLIGVMVGLTVGIGVAVQSAPSAPDVVRAARLEVVDAAGRVVFVAGAQANGSVVQLRSSDGEPGLSLYATDKGGHLRVLNRQGQALFTAGLAPQGEVPSLWERQRQKLAQLEQDVRQLRQELQRASRGFHNLPGHDRLGSTLDRLQREFDTQRRDLDQQRRSIDRQRRDIDSLARQVRALDRR